MVYTRRTGRRQGSDPPLDVLRAQLGKADIAAAEAFVKDWKPDVPDKLANDASFAGQSWKNRQADAQPGNG